MNFFSFLQKSALATSLAMLAVLCSCTTDSDTTPKKYTLYPDNELFFQLYPNDAAQNDSAAANIAHGIILMVSPGGSYRLSFEVDNLEDKPELQLFRILRQGDREFHGIVLRLRPTVENGRLVYEFVCEEMKSTIWYTSLRWKDENYYDAPIRNIRFEGVGTYADDSFALNIIQAGEYTGTADSISLDSLGKMLKEAFETTYGVKIPEVYYTNAADHEVVGRYFPANKPYIVPYDRNTSAEINLRQAKLSVWNTPKVTRALDLLLVHRIDKTGLLGYSPLYGGSMAENGDVVVLSTHFGDEKQLFALNSRDIILTALHESGHFFGLRHTTPTKADALDYSNNDDGLDDTPRCVPILFAGENVGSRVMSDILFRQKIAGYVVRYDCPDNTNLMFPYDSELDELVVSKQQLELVRKNLSLIEH